MMEIKDGTETTPPGNGYEVALMKAGVVKETAPAERRVALVPDAVAKLRAAGIEVLLERGAGEGAWLSDSLYADAGATIVSAAELYRDADVVLTVTKPPANVVGLLRPGQAVIGMLAPLVHPELAAALAAQGVTAISLDRMPRTLTRTQPMDALSSQANVAGYKAALVAAAEFGRFFPMLITAAGTARPAKVLVLGAGVAGLQAIGTARRLGAVVSGYDVRPASKTEVESLGATFIELTAGVSAAGEGGYARELTAEERQVQQDELVGHIARHDVVITTAQVPGRRPPLLVTEDAIKAMTAGSVIVDTGPHQRTTDEGAGRHGRRPGPEPDRRDRSRAGVRRAGRYCPAPRRARRGGPRPVRGPGRPRPGSPDDLPPRQGPAVADRAHHRSRHRSHADRVGADAGRRRRGTPAALRRADPFRGRALVQLVRTWATTTLLGDGSPAPGWHPSSGRSPSWSRRRLPPRQRRSRRGWRSCADVSPTQRPRAPTPPSRGR